MSTTDELLERHAAVWAGLRPWRLSRPPTQQAATLAYRMPPQPGRDPGLRVGSRRRPQGCWRDCEQRQIRLFLSRITDAVRALIEVAMGVVEEMPEAKAGDQPRTTEAPKTDRPLAL